MKFSLTTVLFLITTSVFANVKIIDTQEATEQALVDFQSIASASAINNFNGVKAWPVSGGAKVKVYVKGEDSVEFSCHRHSDSDPFECH